MAESRIINKHLRKSHPNNIMVHVHVCVTMTIIIINMVQPWAVNIFPVLSLSTYIIYIMVESQK